MRQAGVVAAAGVYALDNCVERLADDHRRTKKIGYGVYKKRYAYVYKSSRARRNLKY